MPPRRGARKASMLSTPQTHHFPQFSKGHPSMASTPLKRAIALGFAIVALLLGGAATADETCNSPYMANLIKGQEDFVYVWTLGVEGLGDGKDKLVTVDVNPASK